MSQFCDNVTLCYVFWDGANKMTYDSGVESNL